MTPVLLGAGLPQTRGGPDDGVGGPCPCVSCPATRPATSISRSRSCASSQRGRISRAARQVPSHSTSCRALLARTPVGAPSFLPWRGDWRNITDVRSPMMDAPTAPDDLSPAGRQALATARRALREEFHFEAALDALQADGTQ